ncbi:MAG: sensor histidine kinase [Capsulimonadaceae bacterium]
MALAGGYSDSTTTARTGFWRSLAECIIVCNAVTLSPYLLRFPSPWREIISLVGLTVYFFAAWRLEPGRGDRVQRLLRLLTWLTLLGLVDGIAAYLLWRFDPPTGTVYGLNARALGHVSLVSRIAGSLQTVYGLALPARLLLALGAEGKVHLRSQMTFAFLFIGFLTVVITPLVANIYVVAVSLSSTPPLIAPGDAAGRAARAIRPLVLDGSPTPVLHAALAHIVDGTFRLPLPPGSHADAAESRFSFAGVNTMTLLRPDGTVLASIGVDAPRQGVRLSSDLAGRYAGLLDKARANGVAEARSFEGPLADSAAAVIPDNLQHPAAYLLVNSNVTPITQEAAVINRMAVVVTLAAVTMVPLLLLVALAVLAVAGGGGYLFARRIMRPVERLAAGTESLASGRFSEPLPVESRDEVGTLTEAFNRMAVALREREGALERERDRAERALAANRRLVADISHELRTPLATLRGYLESLQEEHGDSLASGDLAVMERETERLTVLIEDLFTITRSEAKQLPLNITEVDAGRLAAHIVDTIGPLARRERQIEVVSTIPAGLPPVQADAGRLEQVLLNLVQNALRHTQPGGIVAFEASHCPPADGDLAAVALVVADTGVGIDPADLPNVFDRFYRGDPSRARETGGAGLGLAVVKGLVEAMGGSVDVDSVPGRGTRFRVTLPAAM